MRKRFGEIEQNLILLEQAAQLPLSDFLKLPDKVEATMFRLLICIEAAQAVCTYVAPRISSQTPDSAAHCFECLAEAGVYDHEFAARLAAMSRFRNLLEPSTVHGSLPQMLADLRLFMDAMARKPSRSSICRPALHDAKQQALIPRLEGANLQFALLFNSDIGIVGLSDLNALSQLGVALEKAAGLPVDLVDLEKAPTALQFEATRGIPLAVKDPEMLASWKERVWNEYFVQAPFLHDYAREMLQARAQNG